jgi:hypothetical protein
MELYNIYYRSTPVTRLPAEYLYNMRKFDYDYLGISYLTECLSVLGFYKVGMKFPEIYDLCMFIESDDVYYNNLKREALDKLTESLNKMLAGYAELEKYDSIYPNTVAEMKRNIGYFIAQTNTRINTL